MTIEEANKIIREAAIKHLNRGDIPDEERKELAYAVGVTS